MGNKKKSKGSVVEYTLGIIGTGLVAGSVFSFLAGFTVAMILLAVPGFVAWSTAYFAYLKLLEKTADEINPIINEKYDEIYDIGKKAYLLLA